MKSLWAKIKFSGSSKFLVCVVWNDLTLLNGIVRRRDPRRRIQMSVCLTQNKHYNGPPVAPHCSPNIRHRSSALWLTRLKHITVNTSPRIPVDFKRFSRDVNTTCATVILLKRTFSCHVNEMISSPVFIHSFVHSIAPFSSFFGAIEGY